AAPDVDLRAAVLIPLLDVLAVRAEPIAVVLDDLHVVEDAEAIAALDWFLARLPRPHRVLIATRREPALASAGDMRIRGDVLAIGGDARLCAAGGRSRFLLDGLGLELAADEIAALDRRTEGWPAALYLAATRLRLGDSVARVMGRLGATDDLIGGLT